VPLKKSTKPGCGGKVLFPGGYFDLTTLKGKERRKLFTGTIFETSSVRNLAGMIKWYEPSQQGR
jgi:hypothetical protein